MDYYYFYLFIGVLKKKNNMRQMTKISPKFFGHLHNHSFEANVYVHCNMYTRPHLTGKQQTFKSPLYQFHCHLHSLNWTPPERSYSWRSLSLGQQQEKSSSQLQQRQVAKRWWAGLLSLESLLYHTNITVLNIGKGNNINNQKQNWKGEFGRGGGEGEREREREDCLR